MGVISVWEFHETIKDYFSGLDCCKTEFVGGGITIILEDCMRELESGSGTLDGNYRSKHRYTIKFGGDVCTLRVWNDHGINSPVGIWLEQGQIPWHCCTVFKLSESSFIDWVCESQFFGEKRSDLTHYFFGVIGWIIEIVDNIEPIIEVEYLDNTRGR
jgi:hypothetical protein